MGGKRLGGVFPISPPLLPFFLLTFFLHCRDFTRTSCEQERNPPAAPMAKKKTATSTADPAKTKKSGSWERSTVRKGDLAHLRRFGLLPSNQEKVRLPGPEVIPRPEPGWRVMFLPFVVRGLSFPAHEFFRNLLFVYGVQLHQLAPNSILHLAVSWGFIPTRAFSNAFSK